MFKKKQIMAAGTFEKSQSKSCLRGSARRKFSKWMLTAALAASMLASSVGCRISQLAVNEAMLVSYRDMVWAKRAYNLRYGNCDRPYGDHFYNGFCAGYADVCNGGDGFVPALPPVSYRGSRFQSPEGVQCVNAWFEGYPAGVAAARQEKVGNYNNVLVSKMMNEAIEAEKELSKTKRAVTQVNASAKSPKSTDRKMDEKSPPVNADGISIGVPPLPEGDLSSSVLIPTFDYQLVRPRLSNGEALTAKPESGSVSQLPPIVTGSGAIREATQRPFVPEMVEGTSRRLR